MGMVPMAPTAPDAGVPGPLGSAVAAGTRPGQDGRGIDRMAQDETRPLLRSQRWWSNPDDPDMTALYIERYLNWG